MLILDLSLYEFSLSLYEERQPAGILPVISWGLNSAYLYIVKRLAKFMTSGIAGCLT